MSKAGSDVIINVHFELHKKKKKSKATELILCSNKTKIKNMNIY